MGLLLQISIPLLVTFAVLVLISVLRKYVRFETVAVSVAVLAIGVFSLVRYFGVSTVQEQAVKAMAESNSVSLLLANQCILEGEYEEAENILNELSKASLAEDGVLLSEARLAFVRGDYGKAVQLYAEVGDGYGDEAVLASKLLEKTKSGNGSVVKYLTDKGYDPSQYGLSSATADVNETEAVKQITEKIRSTVEQCKDSLGKEAVQATGYAANLLADFSDILHGEDPAEEENLKKMVNRLEKLMEKSDALAGNTHLRIAAMKGNIACEDYESFAESVDENTGSQELTVLTELYVRGLLRKNDFPEEYVSIDKEKVKAVVQQCSDTLEKNKEDLTSQQYKKYKNRVEMLEDQSSNPVTFALRSSLFDKIQTDSDEQKSKSYLALAKIESFSGNSELASEYISEALGTSGESDDDNYRIPMQQMTAIIQGTAESNEVKNVAAYVDQALNYSLPVGMEGNVLAVAENEESDASDKIKEDMNNSVNERTATLNIGSVNKDNFPEVKARIQVQSDKYLTLEDIKNNLIVHDCGSRINDFTLEKMKFQKSRIILLCDVSGSMSGSEQSLKNAIVSFAKDMREGEEVCVIGFDDRIVFVNEFSGDPNVVESYADSINTGGGTALYDSLLYALDLVTQDINCNNIIIAMTDGQDGSPAREGDMYNVLGAKASDKNVTVYTLGLGDVDTAYLEMMADAGNGSFLYADTDEKLENFYNFIHGQLANQYILTYTAKNTTLNARKLELAVDGELGGAEKMYYLIDREYSNEGSEAYDQYTVADTDLTVYGLSTKSLYKSTADQTVRFKGDGFDAGDDVSVVISGNVKYYLDVKYIDEKTYEITVPAAVATGVYDLTFSARGESVTLKKELTVSVQGNEKEFRFGAYRFTANSSSVNENGETVLSGNVVMNEWLFFKGDIKISNYNDTAKVWITDENGAYISYNASTSRGLAKYMAEYGVPVSLGSLGKFAIYGDSYTPESYDKLEVDRIDLTSGFNLLFLLCENCSLGIYPDGINVTGVNFHYQLPFQEQIMRGFNIDEYKTANLDTELILGAVDIALKGKFEYSEKSEEGFTMISLPLNMSKFSVEIDTLANDYSIAGTVKFKSLKKMDGMNYKFGVKGGKFDSISLQANGLDISLLQTPVPVSARDFGFELSGFSKYKSDSSTLSNLLGTTVTCKFAVDVASLDAYAPAIADVIDDEDVALASLDNCELSLTLKEFRMAFSADVVLCTVLDIGKCEIKLGVFDYTNALIGYYDEEQYGLQAALTVGSKWKTTNLELELTGRGELTLGYPYSGLWCNGDAGFDIKWWLLSKDFDVSGDFLIGAYKNSSGNFQFSIIVRGTNNNGDYSGFNLYVTKATGLGMYKY